MACNGIRPPTRYSTRPARRADSRSTRTAWSPSRTASSTCWPVEWCRSSRYGSAVARRPWPRGASEATSSSRSADHVAHHRGVRQVLPSRASFLAMRSALAFGRSARGSARPGTATCSLARTLPAAGRPGQARARRPPAAAPAAPPGSAGGMPSFLSVSVNEIALAVRRQRRMLGMTASAARSSRRCPSHIAGGGQAGLAAAAELDPARRAGAFVIEPRTDGLASPAAGEDHQHPDHGASAPLGPGRRAARRRAAASGVVAAGDVLRVPDRAADHRFRQCLRADDAARRPVRRSRPAGSAARRRGGAARAPGQAAGVDLRFGHAVGRSSRTATASPSRLSTPDGARRMIRTRYLLGCDGAAGIGPGRDRRQLCRPGRPPAQLQRGVPRAVAGYAARPGRAVLGSGAPRRDRPGWHRRLRRA